MTKKEESIVTNDQWEESIETNDLWEESIETNDQTNKMRIMWLMTNESRVLPCLLLVSAGGVSRGEDVASNNTDFGTGRVFKDDGHH